MLVRQIDHHNYWRDRDGKVHSHANAVEKRLQHDVLHGHSYQAMVFGHFLR
jgi:hypothetical protein